MALEGGIPFVAQGMRAYISGRIQVHVLQLLNVNCASRFLRQRHQAEVDVLFIDLALKYCEYRLPCIVHLLHPPHTNHVLGESVNCISESLCKSYERGPSYGTYLSAV